MSQNLLELLAPKANLATGHLQEYDRDPLGFWMMCAKKYGEIVMLDFGGMPVCFISKPQLIEEVLWDRTSFIKGNVAEMLEDLFGKGLFTSDGETWKLQRQSMQALFLQKKIASYAEIMVDRTEKMLKNWSDGESLDIRSEMRKLTINITTKAIFNQDLTDAEAQIIKDSFARAMDW